MTNSNINQKVVMNQKIGPDGDQACGYHTYKNMLLSILYFNGYLTLERYDALLKDTHIFSKIFEKVKVEARAGNQIDLTIDQMMARLENKQLKSVFQEIEFDLPDEKITAFKKNISASLFPFFPGSEYATTEMEEDLENAAKIVKLARTSGETSHVFGLGMLEHWVCTAVKQNASGQREWLFMDSYGNSTTHKNNVVDKLESVLRKSPAELSAYLIHVYNSSSDLFNRRYNLFFEQNGNTIPDRQPGLGPHGDQELNAEEFFVDNLENAQDFSQYIEHRFQFMKDTGWLDCDGIEESEHRLRLYNLTKFMYSGLKDKGLDHQKIANRLKPIYQALEKVSQPNQIKAIETPDFKVAKEKSLREIEEENSTYNSFIDNYKEEHQVAEIAYQSENDLKLLCRLEEVIQENMSKEAQAHLQVYLNPPVELSVIVTIFNRKAREKGQDLLSYIQDLKAQEAYRQNATPTGYSGAGTFFKEPKRLTSKTNDSKSLAENASQPVKKRSFTPYFSLGLGVLGVIGAILFATGVFSLPGIALLSFAGIGLTSLAGAVGITLAGVGVRQLSKGRQSHEQPQSKPRSHKRVTPSTRPEKTPLPTVGPKNSPSNTSEEEHTVDSTNAPQQRK